MLVVHIQVHVKPEFVEAFKEASVENARNSVLEPGVARFDIVQQATDPARFVFVEVYRSPDAVAQHRETAHYLTWRDKAAPMMAEPRSRMEYSNVFPGDEGW